LRTNSERFSHEGKYGKSFQRFEIKGITAALQMLDLPAGRILTRDHKEKIKIEAQTNFVQPAWSFFLKKVAS
jgi:hypothetical protein